MDKCRQVDHLSLRLVMPFTTLRCKTMRAKLKNGHVSSHLFKHRELSHTGKKPRAPSHHKTMKNTCLVYKVMSVPLINKIFIIYVYFEITDLSLSNSMKVHFSRPAPSQWLLAINREKTINNKLSCFHQSSHS